MGSRHRLTYTAIGDAVNLAFRLQSATRDYRVGTLVGEDTATRYPSMLFRELDQVTLRGKSSMTRIYEPVCLQWDADEEMKANLKLHQHALQHWYDKQLSEARSLLLQLHTRYPETGYYEVMLERLDGQ